jgi:hypothetical protein
MSMARFRLVGLALGIALVATARAAEFHASPGGTPQGNGSEAKPWDLATALAATETVKPGDTVWLHGGTYRGGFASRLSGKAGAPIVVRGRPGQRATIDTHPRDERDNGLLVIFGADTVYRDFEVTCSHPQRETKIAGSWPADIRRGSVDIRGDRIAVVNLVVHDCANGFGFWSEGEGGEISGCLIYNNGWQGPDRGHGHGIYAQNARGIKKIKDNIVFHQFGYGIHSYGSAKAAVKDFEIDGNIVFENGCLARGDDRAGILLGGESPAEGLVARDNVVVRGGMRFGYPWGTTNIDLVCTGNYCESLVVRDFLKGKVTGNTVVAHSNAVQLEGAASLLKDGLTWDENDYYITDGRWGECAVVENSKSRGLSFEEWRKATGFDSKSTLQRGQPQKLRVVVRPNAYEPGRAHVAVLNPEGLPEVGVDLSAVLKRGEAYRIVSAKDFFGEPVASGTYENGPVSIPLKPVQPPKPVGMPSATLPITEPGFAAFVVLRGQ